MLIEFLLRNQSHGANHARIPPLEKLSTTSLFVCVSNSIERHKMWTECRIIRNNNKKCYHICKHCFTNLGMKSFNSGLERRNGSLWLWAVVWEGTNWREYSQQKKAMKEENAWDIFGKRWLFLCRFRIEYIEGEEILQGLEMKLEKTMDSWISVQYPTLSSPMIRFMF